MTENTNEQPKSYINIDNKAKNFYVDNLYSVNITSCLFRMENSATSLKISHMFVNVFNSSKNKITKIEYKKNGEEFQLIIDDVVINNEYLMYKQVLDFCKYSEYITESNEPNIDDDIVFLFKKKFDKIQL